MNFLNGLTTSVFNVLLTPFEWVSDEFALVMMSGIFGILALLIFKQISSQRGIKQTKGKIKGHMIAIRIYQDDLMVVFTAVCKVMIRNLQYLFLNFGPIIPLGIPFVLMASQMVTRYGYDPLPEESSFKLVVALKADERARVKEVEFDFPDWVDEESLRVVRAPSDGKLFLEVQGAQAGHWEFGFRLGDEEAIKMVHVGEERPRALQPTRVGDFWSAWLLPVEDAFGGDSPFERIDLKTDSTFDPKGYPDRDLAWMPDGEFGILIVIVVVSMAFGFAALKPLGVQI